MAHEFDPQDTSELYKRHAERWKMELDFSEMTLDVLNSGRYLPQFSTKEHSDDYAYRISMSAPLDTCRDGVQIRVDNLFRTAPKREVEGTHAAIINGLIEDADGDGTGIDEFMRGAAWDMYATGTDIVAQMTSTAAEVITLADQQEAGLVPFFTRFSPLERFDWATNGTGSYIWARFSLGEEPRDDEQDSQDVTVTRYLTLSATEWRIWRVTAAQGKNKVIELEASGTLNLDKPPITKLYVSESNKPGQGAVPLSLITRPAVVAKVLLNIKSQADADLLAAVTRYFLTGGQSDNLPDTYAPGAVWKMADPDAKLTVAQGDVGHIAEKRDWVNLYIGEILRLLKFRGGMAEINASQGSGLKLKIERTDLENELRTTAGQMEDTETEMMRQAVSLATGAEVSIADLGYSVHYNRQYNLEPIAEMLENLEKWLTKTGFASDDVPEITRELTRRVQGVLVREGTPTHDQITEEIEAANFEGASADATGIGTNDNNLAAGPVQ
jgi:hypothetical protein